MGFIQSLDQLIFHWINHDLTNSIFDVFFPFITDLHKTMGFKFIVVPVLFVLLIYFLRLKGALMTFFLALSLGLSDKIGSLIKHAVQRQRPFEIGIEVIQRSGAGGFSFPSNHSLNMFCAATFLSAFFPRCRWIFFLAAFLVAFSRVYNGVHFPMDVICGGMIGALFGYIGAKLTKWLHYTIEAKRKARHV